MSEQPPVRTIYRRPGSAGNPPTMQTIQRHDGTLNTRRLRAASPLMTAHPHSRRAPDRRGLLLFLLVVAALAAVALVVITASRPGSAHGNEIEPTQTPTLVAIIDPWPQECAPGAACYFAFAPLLANTTEAQP